MGIYFFMFICMLVVVGVVALFSYGVHVSTGEHYDERQNLSRGKAGTMAFYTMEVLTVIYFLYSDTLPETYLRLDTSLFLIMLLFVGLAVFCCYNILHESYFGVGKNYWSKNYYSVFWLVVSGLYFANYRLSLEEGESIFSVKNGVIIMNGVEVSFVAGVAFMAIGICGIIRLVANRRQEE